MSPVFKETLEWIDQQASLAEARADRHRVSEVTAPDQQTEDKYRTLADEAIVRRDGFRDVERILLACVACFEAPEL